MVTVSAYSSQKTYVMCMSSVVSIFSVMHDLHKINLNATDEGRIYIQYMYCPQNTSAVVSTPTSDH